MGPGEHRGLTCKGSVPHSSTRNRPFVSGHGWVQFKHPQNGDPGCYSRMWNQPGEALGHAEEPPAGTLCRFSLYSLLGSRPSATIITLFLPKKILKPRSRRREMSALELTPLGIPLPPPAHLLCFQAFRTSFSLLFLMLATEKTKMYL